MKKQYDILILGSGPAGINAAMVCKESCASVALVDMGRSPGGRVLKTKEDGIDLLHTTRAEHTSSKKLRKLFDSLAGKVDYYSGTTLADIVGKTAVLDGPQGQHRLEAKAIILAPGAVEAPALFPNWTTPGIYTLGAYNAMIKRGQRLDKKVLVAGSGPLLYAVAANVNKAGGELVGLLDAASINENIGLAKNLVYARYYDKMKVAGKALPALLGTKWKRRCRIASVEGEAGNFTIRTVFMDADWKTVKAGPAFQAEAIAVSYGLHPNTDLSRRLECRHSYDPISGIWMPVLDSFLRTSVDGIYVAGDGALVKGYEGAAVDGRLAAYAALIDMNKVKGVSKEIRKLQALRLICEQFAAQLIAISEPGDGYFAELEDTLTICRCEAITIKDIKRALSEGARDRNGVKKRVRLGMGHCQGRICGQVIDRILARLAGPDCIHTEFSPRTPVMPVRIGVLAGETMPVDEEFRN